MQMLRKIIMNEDLKYHKFKCGCYYTTRVPSGSVSTLYFCAEHSHIPVNDKTLSTNMMIQFMNSVLKDTEVPSVEKVVQYMNKTLIKNDDIDISLGDMLHYFEQSSNK